LNFGLGNVGIPAIFIGVYYREKTLEELRTSVIILMALIILYLMCEYVLKIKQYRTIVGLISVSGTTQRTKNTQISCTLFTLRV
jgi:hypothetical protein